jgi:hypothetical protein
MSNPTHERIYLIGKMASLFMVTMLIVMGAMLLCEDLNRAKEASHSWPSLQEGSEDKEAGFPWWKDANFKPIEGMPPIPGISGQGQPQPWSPVQPGQEPVHLPGEGKGSAPTTPPSILR